MNISRRTFLRWFGIGIGACVVPTLQQAPVIDADSSAPIHTGDQLPSDFGVYYSSHQPGWVVKPASYPLNILAHIKGDDGHLRVYGMMDGGQVVYTDNWLGGATTVWHVQE